MRDKESVGLTPERTDWSSAWKAVSRLAATRESLREMDHDEMLATESESGRREPGSGATSVTQIIALDREQQLAGAIAEIEKASAVLRRSEPALEPGLPSTSGHSEGRSYWSLWILIGSIWISATLVVASATGAILYLLG